VKIKRSRKEEVEVWAQTDNLNEAFDSAVSQYNRHGIDAVAILDCDLQLLVTIEAYQPEPQFILLHGEKDDT